MAAFFEDYAPVTVDDRSLLRAIIEYEATLEQDEDEGQVSVLHRHVINREDFKILKDNDHLRGLLKTFLETNLEVRSTKNLVEAYGMRIIRWIRKKELNRFKDELITNEAARDEAFKPYEMLRKLTSPDNFMLIRKFY